MFPARKRTNFTLLSQCQCSGSEYIEFWIQILNFGPIWIRIQGYVINYERKIKNNFRKKCPQKYLFLKVSEWRIRAYIITYVFNLTPFAKNVSYIYLCGSGSLFVIRIRIHKGPEYGSNQDPDPQQGQQKRKDYILTTWRNEIPNISGELESTSFHTCGLNKRGAIMPYVPTELKVSSFMINKTLNLHQT